MRKQFWFAFALLMLLFSVWFVNYVHFPWLGASALDKAIGLVLLNVAAVATMLIAIAYDRFLARFFAKRRAKESTESL